MLAAQVFNTEGEFLLKFGSNGEGNGQFNAPTGVAVDVNGNIIVADWGNSRIQVSAGSVTVTDRANVSSTPKSSCKVNIKPSNFSVIWLLLSIGTV